MHAYLRHEAIQTMVGPLSKLNVYTEGRTARAPVLHTSGKIRILRLNAANVCQRWLPVAAVPPRVVSHCVSAGSRRPSPRSSPAMPLGRRPPCRDWLAAMRCGFAGPARDWRAAMPRRPTDGRPGTRNCVRPWSACEHGTRSTVSRRCSGSRLCDPAGWVCGVARVASSI